MNSPFVGFVRRFLLAVSVLGLAVPLLSRAQAPHITQQPQSQTVVASANVTFTVAATGKAPLSYYWSFNGTTLTDGGRISGAQTAALTILNTLASDAGTYQVIVSNRQGIDVSAPAALTVLVPPVITTQPQDRSAIVGTTASFAAAATGTSPLAYQWFFENVRLTNNARISGATSPTLSLSNLQTNDAGSYWLRVTNIAGVATSQVAHLTVLVPPAIRTQPQSQTVLVGNLATFTVEATGTAPLGYQWFLNGTPKPGATTSSLSIPSAQPADAGSYTVVVTNSVGSVSSTPAILTVLEPPAITTQPRDQTAIAGTNVLFTAVASGTSPLAYQWFFENAPLSDNDRISGATSPMLSLSNIQTNDVGSYWLTVTNIAGVATSQVARLAVLVPPAIRTQPQDQTVDVGEPATFTVEAAGTAPLAYQWFLNGTPKPGATTSSLYIPSAQLADAGSYTVLVTNNVGSISSAPAILTVLQAPAITQPPLDLAAALGSTASFSVTATGTAPLSYRWQKNGVDLADNGRITGTTTTNLAIAGVQAGDLGGYRVVVTNLAGTATSPEARLAIIPLLAWGASDAGQTTLPLAASNVIAIAAGYQHNLALLADGTAVGWGDNSYGQAAVPPDATNLVAVAAGVYHSLGLRADGTVAAWGANDYGASTVPAEATNVVAIAAGDYQSLALRADGTVVAWGANFYGQGTVPADATNVVAIAAGWYHNVALRSDGTVVAWGANFYGQAPAPANAVNVTAVAAGAFHSLALRSDGTVLAWGDNTYGQAAPPPAATNLVAIAAGAQHNLALRSDGTVLAWGGNDYGQLSIPASATNLLAIAAGGYHNLVLARAPSAQAPPKVWQQTVNRAVLGGDAVAFVAGASGSLPFRFQWLYQGAPLPGQTNNWLGLFNISPEQAGAYQVAVANAFGSVTSAVANLTVLSPLRILSQPAAQAIVLYGSATFTVEVAGTRPLSYQWLKDGVALSDDGRITGATTSALTITGALTNDAGHYSVIVSNAYATVTSDSASLTMAVPPGIVTQPASQIAIAGSNATFNVVATGSEPLLYQWFFNASPLSDNARISGAASASLTLSNVQTADTGSYSVSITNVAGFILSAPATLTVIQPPAILTQPVGRSVALGFPAGFSVTVAGTPPLACQWQLNGADIPGATNTSLNIPAAGPADFGLYQVLVSNSAGTVASLPARLTLSPVAAWARSDLGQTVLPAGLSNVVAVSAGLNHSLALRADGTVAAWGDNTYGQTNVPAALSNVVAIAAGAYHSLALRANGTVAAWGYNNYGQTNVPGTLSNVVAIAAGTSHSLALRADGIVVAWGSSSYGQATVPAGLRKVAAIAAGANHSLALCSDGTAVAWGFSNYGQTNVPAGLTNAIALAGGTYHSLALRADGTVVAWGYNSYGQTNVPAGLSNAVGIAAGDYYSLALRSDGTLLSWGRNNYGQTNTPAAVTNVLAIAAGGGHNLALLGDGRPVLVDQPVGGTFFTGRALVLQAQAAGAGPLAYQWQHDGVSIDGATNATLLLPSLTLADQGNYQVLVTNPLGSAVSQPAPLTVRDRVGPFLMSLLPARQTNYLSSRVALGVSVGGCGPLSYQWRFNNQILPGATNEELVLDPLKLTNAGTYSLMVTNAYGALVTAGDILKVLEIKVWGVSRGLYYPNDAPASASNVAAIACGLYQFAALRADGVVVTWGQKDIGYPGVGALAMSNAIAVASGDSHYLAIRRDRTVAAWGSNTYGQTNVPAGLNNVVAVGGGAYHSLALRADGTVAVWGYNNYGQTNIPASATGVVAIAAGSFHNLAVRGDGSIVGWGFNNYGQAGGPSPRVGNSNFVAVAAGYLHSLGLRANGTVVAWGYNNFGQTNVPAGLSNVVAIGAGTYYSVALRADGTVVTWGTYYDLQQGPATAPPDLAYVSQIAAGGDNGMALFGTRAPNVTLQPWSRTVYRGSNVTFVAKAAGVQPVQYQWLFNGAAIPGASTDTLALTNVQFADSGAYQLLVSNVYGSGRSVSAKLMVTLPLAEALDTTNLTWTSTGSDPWYGQVEVSQDGIDAARSGGIGNSQESILQTTVIGPGTLSWWWKVSSEEDFDILEFKVGGVTQAAISGEVGWEQRSFPVPAGTQTLQWRYSKDATFTDGLDAAWVDQVVFIPAPPVLTHQPASLTVNAGASVYWYATATGTPPFSYQWFKEGSPLQGATGSSLTLNNATRRTGGAYAVQVSNGGGPTLSSNAVLKVLVPQRLGSPQLLPGGILSLTSGDSDGGLLTAADLANFEAQASTNLVNWVTLPDSLTVTNGLLQLLDPDAVNHPYRFYRVLEH